MQYEMLRRYTKVLLRIETSPAEAARLSETPLSLAELAHSTDAGRGSLEQVASGKGVEDALHSTDNSLRDRRRQHLERSTSAQQHSYLECHRYLQNAEAAALEDSPLQLPPLFCTSSTRDSAKGPTIASSETLLQQPQNKSAEKLVALVRGGGFWNGLDEKLRGVARVLLERAQNSELGVEGELNALGGTRVMWLKRESDSSSAYSDENSDSESNNEEL